MKAVFNKQVFVTVALAVILPIVGMMGMGALVSRFNPQPASVPAVVDSGERWYNPLSWENDELAAIAHQQAEAAQNNSVGFTGSTVWMVMGAVGLGLALVYGANDVRKEVGRASLTNAHKERPTPRQLPPIAEEDNADEELLTKATSAKHPAAAGA
jgi:Na+-transporting methylmalonyl-CoA/oxaloacetate decarboxylase gamma subunit